VGSALLVAAGPLRSLEEPKGATPFDPGAVAETTKANAVRYGSFGVSVFVEVNGTTRGTLAAEELARAQWLAVLPLPGETSIGGPVVGCIGVDDPVVRTLGVERGWWLRGSDKRLPGFDVCIRAEDHQ